MMPTNGGAALRTERVTRQYQMGSALIRAVDEVSLQVGAAEFVALLGSSGSGKSTLLNLMAGLDRPTSGAVIAHGQDLSKVSSLELARYRRQTVGMVFQSFNLLPRMTLEENVELPLRLAEVGRADRAARVRESLERVGLAKRIGHRPSELSGGEQQRAAIARALVNRPRILLADEPTGNLDSATGESILMLLREIQKNPGMTIVMVTHERPLAKRSANGRSRVTMTMVMPGFFWISRRSIRMDSPVALSRFPVGSSARRILGRLTSARAIAARCCSPPESSLGRWPMRLARPTRSRDSRTRAARSARPTSPRRSGNSPFSSSVIRGRRLKDWKTMPTV